MKPNKNIKKRLFPVIYGIFSAIVSFIAGFFIAKRSFHLNLQMSILIAGVIALLCFILAYFRGHASAEIKRIVAKYHLQDTDLAKITGMRASDFPIYHNQLSLIIPKRDWPRVLDALQKFERAHPLDKEEKTD
ncbi:MAG: hypothetical protein LKF01_02645 [Lactobacillus sp.]|jgi:hypothetical protein|nr:hypothetical protein [Lactobacillus sp.]MCH3905577.1 hypothetical protein [Lactobacillus sp.]MCH3990864.1 hypothetical protein [Lactobacillus sp.]MCH4068420.1 hypothetical protein [Lactobacillus sp.]MCI1304560.1 hypothetical protein [Lactobacillus sp.]